MLRKLLIMGLMLVMIGGVAAQEDDGAVFVLVHGAFQDASGWDAVIAALEADGQTAIAVEQPGHGDETPLGEVMLVDYVEAVIAVIEQQDAPVILVGHSFGGLIISQVAEAVPQRIETLVYLAAYLPRNEDNLLTLASQDRYSLLGQEGNFIVAEDFTFATVNPDVFATAFCPDCTPDQLIVVAESQINEPLAPLNTPVTITDDNFGSVRKVYILTAQDIVISPQLQALMLANTPVDHVYALDTGHAPYISQPDALAAVLIQASAR